MKIRELEKIFTVQLSVLYDFEEARNLAWLAISFVCRLNRMEYLAAKQDELSTMDETSLSQILVELETGKPLQYVLGETEFYGLPFKVNSSVLIPRPETEELVDWIIKDLRNNHSEQEIEQLHILDIGTGSGCIPISLKKNLPSAKVVAIDISSGAIDTAIRNSVLNHSEVGFFMDDIFNPVRPEIVNKQFNLIVSNPPYVTQAEKKQMHQNVLAFEPHTALFVSDDDPLKFYKTIVVFAKKHLKNKGKLFLEINENLGEETVDLLRQSGFVHIELRKDLRGCNRMIKAEHNPD